MANLEFCVGGDCKEHLKQRVNVFKQEMDEELIFILSPDFGFDSAARRLLSERDSFDIQEDIGVKTYISKETDEEIEYMQVRAGEELNSDGRTLLLIIILIYAAI